MFALEKGEGVRTMVEVLSVYENKLFSGLHVLAIKLFLIYVKPSQVGSVFEGMRGRRVRRPCLGNEVMSGLIRGVLLV